MRIMNSITNLIVAITSAISIPLLAQNPGEGASIDSAGRNAWLICTSIPEGLENPVKVMAGKELTQVTLSKRAASEPIKIPADGTIRLVKEISNPENPDKPTYQTLAQAVIPQEMKKALIILVPTAKKPEDLIFNTRIKDLSKFTAGSSLYMNLTNLKVGVSLGEENLLVEPGQDKVYVSPKSNQVMNIPVRYSFYHPTKNQWRIISASTIALYPTRREICIFSWDEEYQRLDYHGLTFSDH